MKVIDKNKKEGSKKEVGFSILDNFDIFTGDRNDIDQCVVSDRAAKHGIPASTIHPQGSFRDGCFFRTHIRTACPIPFYPGELSDRPDCPLSIPPRSCSSNTRWLRSLHDHPLIFQHKVVPGVLKNRSVHTELPHQV